jgi:hypothetical protein
MKKKEKKGHSTVGRKTVGEVYNLTHKAERPETTQDLLDTQKPAAVDYMQKLHKTVRSAVETYPGQPYVFVEAFTRKDKLMVRALVTEFFTRSSCPTPSFNQAVYRYDVKNGRLEFAWQLPSNKRCLHYLANPFSLDEGERLIIGYVHDLKSGALEQLAINLNNEEYQAGLALVKDDENSEGDIYVG